MFPSPTKRSLTESNHAERWSPSRVDLDDETANKLANIGRRARQSVTEGYKSPSVSPVKYGTGGDSYFGAGGSPSTTPTRVRPGLAHAYASSPPANAFISDRDARQLAANQTLAGRSDSTSFSSSSSNPFLASTSSSYSSSSSSANAMDLDGPPSSAAAGLPRNPSPLKRTSRARSRSPEYSPPTAAATAAEGNSGRKIRNMPLRATQSLPAPPPAPVFTPGPASAARAAGWPSSAQDDSMGDIESAGGGGSGSWPLGSVSEWARSEDF